MRRGPEWQSSLRLDWDTAMPFLILLHFVTRDRDGIIATIVFLNSIRATNKINLNAEKVGFCVFRLFLLILNAKTRLWFCV